MLRRDPGLLNIVLQRVLLLHPVLPVAILQGEWRILHCSLIWAHTLKLMKCFAILSVQVWHWQLTGVLRPKPKPVNFLFGEPTPPHSHPDIKVKHIKIYFTSFQIITNIALEGIVLKHHSQPDSLLPLRLQWSWHPLHRPHWIQGSSHLSYHFLHRRWHHQCYQCLLIAIVSCPWWAPQL